MSDEENLHGQIINVLTEYKLPTPPFHFKIKILISLGLDTVTKSTVAGRPDCSVSRDQSFQVQPIPTDVRKPTNTEVKNQQQPTASYFSPFKLS